MCRTLVEIKYPICQHQATWDIQSPDPNCNGILHRLVFDTTKVCKHCWVDKHGQRKKAWKRAGGEPGFVGERFIQEWYQHRNINKMVYPIQEVGSLPTSDCPTWQKRRPWHTRMWAVRQLYLQRMSRIIERKVWEQTGRPEFIQNVWTIDQDTKGDGNTLGDAGELLAVVPIAELNPEDRDCVICRLPFVGEEDPEDLCSGGGEVARRLPCPGGHVVGVGCIVIAWKYAIEDRNMPQCPLCRHKLNVMVLSPQPFKKRLEKMAERYHKGLLDGQRRIDTDYPERDPKAITFLQYVLYSTSLIASFPTFTAVNHSMNIWNSKYGKLPYAQIAVIIAAGAVLQGIWLLALLLFFPLLAIFYPFCGPGARREPQADPLAHADGPV